MGAVFTTSIPDSPSASTRCRPVLRQRTGEAGAGQTPNVAPPTSLRESVAAQSQLTTWLQGDGELTVRADRTGLLRTPSRRVTTCTKGQWMSASLSTSKLEIDR